MNLLHGDHTAASIVKGNDMAAVLESHNFGAPTLTLAEGRACDWYNFRTIDSLGASTSAE